MNMVIRLGDKRRQVCEAATPDFPSKACRSSLGMRCEAVISWSYGHVVPAGNQQELLG